MPEQLDSILGIKSQQELRAVSCSKCNATNEPDAGFCTVCGQTLTVSAPPEIASRAPSGGESVIVSSMMRRYKDAYLIAKATTGFGALIKGVGIILALLIVLVAYGVANQAPRGSEAIVIIVGIFWAVVAGFLFYLMGVLISAQGQILKASLDGAVNSSPFLGNEEKAKVMSLL